MAPSLRPPAAMRSPRPRLPPISPPVSQCAVIVDIVCLPFRLWCSHLAAEAVKCPATAGPLQKELGAAALSLALALGLPDNVLWDLLMVAEPMTF